MTSIGNGSVSASGEITSP